MPTEAGIANDSSKAIERRFRTIFHSQVQFIGLLSADGQLIWVDFSFSPFFGDDGRVEYLI